MGLTDLCVLEQTERRLRCKQTKHSKSLTVSYCEYDGLNLTLNEYYIKWLQYKAVSGFTKWLYLLYE